MAARQLKEKKQWFFKMERVLRFAEIVENKKRRIDNVGFSRISGKKISTARME
jgi:hypothetical protein